MKASFSPTHRTATLMWFYRDVDETAGRLCDAHTQVVLVGFDRGSTGGPERMRVRTVDGLFRNCLAEELYTGPSRMSRNAFEDERDEP